MYIDLYIKVCKFQMDKNLSLRQGEVKEKVKIDDEEKLETSELTGVFIFFSLEQMFFFFFFLLSDCIINYCVFVHWASTPV